MPKVIVRYTGKEERNIGRYGLVKPQQSFELHANDQSHFLQHGHDHLEIVSEEELAAERKAKADALKPKQQQDEEAMSQAQGKDSPPPNAPKNKQAGAPNTK